MFFGKKKRNNLISYLAQMSAISENATTDQMSKLLDDLGDYPKEVYAEFLLQKDTFRNCIPSS